MNMISKRKESFRLDEAKGPAFCNVPQTANADRISAIEAVCRGCSRSAAHNSGSIVKKPNKSRIGSDGIEGVNATKPTIAAPRYASMRLGRTDGSPAR